MTLSKAAFLKVVEKFRAPAALYCPSKNPGDGWIEISSLEKGGEAIIQVQEDAKLAKKFVAIVRFQFRHGKDFLNARILPGLPLKRKGSLGFLFKALSSNSGNYDVKTVFFLKFGSKDDADDFMMWWLAKNGSMKALLVNDGTSKRKPLCKSTNHLPSKRKAKNLAGKFCDQVEPPLKRVCNKTEKNLDGNVFREHEVETNFDIVGKGDKVAKENGEFKIDRDSASDPKAGTGDSNRPYKPIETVAHNESESEEVKCEGDEVEVFIHDGYLPQSQDWMSAFLLEEDEK